MLGAISLHKKVIEESEISFESTLTRTCNPMTRSDTPVVMTRF